MNMGSSGSGIGSTVTRSGTPLVDGGVASVDVAASAAGSAVWTEVVDDEEGNSAEASSSSSPPPHAAAIKVSATKIVEGSLDAGTSDEATGEADRHNVAATAPESRPTMSSQRPSQNVEQLVGDVTLTDHQARRPGIDLVVLER